MPQNSPPENSITDLTAFSAPGARQSKPSHNHRRFANFLSASNHEAIAEANLDNGSP
jgi:hypothetical protein